MKPMRITIEELANAVTHGIGLVLSIAGLIALVVIAVLRGTMVHIVACSIYGGSLVCLYAASTLYHSVVSPRLKQALEIFDHSAIYLLIAGTYTPFLLISLRGTGGWWLLCVIWGLALIGIVLKLWFTGRFNVISTAGYLAMGWIGVISARAFIAHVPVTALYWLIAGAVAYNLGIIFYATKRIPYSHAIWHMFVLTGSVCHFVAVLSTVLPART